MTITGKKIKVGSNVQIVPPLPTSVSKTVTAEPKCRRTTVKLLKLFDQPVVFVQPARPSVVKVNGVVTRKIAANNYDDEDKNQNELIGMERGYSGSMPESRPMPKKKKFKLFQKQCKKGNLPPPLPFERFEAIDWNHVSECDENRLLPEYKFKTPEELKVIPRRHPKFPFCHPGPVRDENMQIGVWYYADSIVQEVKFLGVPEPFYNVRWIGYEDE